MQQQLQRAAVSGIRTPGLPLFPQRGMTAGIRGPALAQHAAASLAGRIRAPTQVVLFLQILHGFSRGVAWALL